MPKRFSINIGPRDVEMLIALDRTPLTPAQLCRLSETFSAPFGDEHNLRRRLRLLANAGLVRSWPYAIVNEGRSPRYFKLSRDGYRLVYGADAVLPRRRYFEEISHGHHHHTNALAEVIIQIVTTGFRRGIRLQHFGRENSVRLEANGFTMFPDSVFQLAAPCGRRFNFVVELDNGTERVRTQQDVESIERKLRAYDAHQSQFAADDPRRYLVLFVTTRSETRVQNILNRAGEVMSNQQRTVFLACGTNSLAFADPFDDACFTDHRGLHRTLIPRFASEQKKPTSCMTTATVS